MGKNGGDHIPGECAEHVKDISLRLFQVTIEYSVPFWELLSRVFQTLEEMEGRDEQHVRTF